MEKDSLLSPIIEATGFTILEKLTLPRRAPRYSPSPNDLSPSIRDYLLDQFESGLFSHQSEALREILKGHDVVLSTATASGKSLVFMCGALDRLLTSAQTTALALYPARALIEDQLGKWISICERFDLSVGRIDGGVPIADRIEILRGSRIILMTPDVLHAWMMSHLSEESVSSFLSRLRFLVLDEAHVYEGAFGTNMAYLLRRLFAVLDSTQVVCSTATLGAPATFYTTLIGREARCFTDQEDGSGAPDKSVLLLYPKKDTFAASVELIAGLTAANDSPFIAFGDSRKQVEQIVARVHSKASSKEDQTAENEYDDILAEDAAGDESSFRVLPYRAGLETEDRRQIQKALSAGRLSGVVSTSALELGLDIGELGVAILLGIPPSVKSFWQRLGRAGRRDAGICMIIDGDGLIQAMGGLRAYLERPLEPNVVYLENKYIQYTNALCAALETQESGLQADQSVYRTLPSSFSRFLENELNPTEIVSPDLFPLKQRAQGGPHREFPLRTGIEPNFSVRDARSLPLGNLTLSQALREAYPGAIYYYMARPYRVYRFVFRRGQILVKRTRHWTTKPLLQTMVFPQYQTSGIYQLVKSDRAFVAECEMQVSERVLGFIESRGPTKIEHRYGSESLYYQRELNRFFETTGVSWRFPERETNTEGVALLLLEALCTTMGIQERDLGWGSFHALASPLGGERCQGVCIYDGVSGSLRLTQKLMDNFSEVARIALKLAQSRHASIAVKGLKAIIEHLPSLDAAAPNHSTTAGEAEDPNAWTRIVAPGEEAMYHGPAGPEEVEILGYRYTPHGLMYELRHRDKDQKWMVLASDVQPLFGSTRVIEVNLITGEERSC